jgi:hypothetical protein
LDAGYTVFNSSAGFEVVERFSGQFRWAVSCESPHMTRENGNLLVWQRSISLPVPPVPLDSVCKLLISGSDPAELLLVGVTQRLYVDLFNFGGGDEKTHVNPAVSRSIPSYPVRTLNSCTHKGGIPQIRPPQC